MLSFANAPRFSSGEVKVQVASAINLSRDIRQTTEHENSRAPADEMLASADMSQDQPAGSVSIVINLVTPSAEPEHRLMAGISELQTVNVEVSSLDENRLAMVVGAQLGGDALAASLIASSGISIRRHLRPRLTPTTEWISPVWKLLEDDSDGVLLDDQEAGYANPLLAADKDWIELCDRARNVGRTHIKNIEA